MKIIYYILGGFALFNLFAVLPAAFSGASTGYLFERIVYTVISGGLAYLIYRWQEKQKSNSKETKHNKNLKQESMKTIDLNKVAICMGKVTKLLSDLDLKIRTGNDVYENKEDLCCIAYMCRIGILDRLEKIDNTLLSTLSIRVPKGLFGSGNETIASALDSTIGKLKEIVSRDVVTENYIEDILNKRGVFYEYENILPNNFKQNL